MTEERLRKILSNFEDITPSEWVKIKESVDRVFENKITEYKRQLKLGDVEKVVDSFKANYSLTT